MSSCPPPATPANARADKRDVILRHTGQYAPLDAIFAHVYGIRRCACESSARRSEMPEPAAIRARRRLRAAQYDAAQ